MSTTHAQAIQNLMAFSEDGSAPDTESSSPGDLIPFAMDVAITGCLGWAEFEGRRSIDALGPSRHNLGYDLPQSKRFFGNFYQLVPEETLEKATILSQTDFFHVVGFSITEFAPSNWRGKGTLVDFSDIISPIQPYYWGDGVYPSYYKSFAKRVQIGLDRVEEYRAFRASHKQAYYNWKA